MNIQSLADAAGYILPIGGAENELRDEVAAVSSDSASARIVLASDLIKSRTHIELFWDEIVAFEHGTKLRTLLAKRVTTWKDITKPVIGRSSKRSYALLPKSTIQRDPSDTDEARRAAIWGRIHSKEQLAASASLRPESSNPSPASAPPPSDPVLQSIDEKLRILTALKALEMQAKAHALGEAFRNPFF